MNKKILLLLFIFSLFAVPAFSTVGFEFGIGSGYIFYGDSETKDRNKALGDTNQTILATDALMLLPVNDLLVFSLGGDMTFDFRWKGSNHIYLFDYAFLAGVKVFPKIGGLFVGVDYALGRRTDFIEFDNYDGAESTQWGNGFKFSLGYDFSYHMTSLAPVLCASLKSMPRGGSRDNLFCVSIKLTKHR